LPDRLTEDYLEKERFMKAGLKADTIGSMMGNEEFVKQLSR